LETYLTQNIIPDNTYRNWNAWEKKVEGIIDMKWFQLLNDPQTSGGLLISVAPNAYFEVKALMEKFDLANFIHPIGTILDRHEMIVVVKS
jgi:selenide,water dikinase